ncbi:MAG: sarcosine oxidase subunit delta [Burkholderiaceae bacterium]
MLLIMCPYCGDRAVTEFQSGGELTKRPDDPNTLTTREWNDYLFYRTNHKGVVRELWWHQFGCRQWFETQRDTTNNNFVSLTNAEPE